MAKYKVILICSLGYADEYNKAMMNLAPNAHCKRGDEMVANAAKYPDIAKHVRDDEEIAVINLDNNDWCRGEDFFSMHDVDEFTTTQSV